MFYTTGYLFEGQTSCSKTVQAAILLLILWCHVLQSSLCACVVVFLDVGTLRITTHSDNFAVNKKDCHHFPKTV